VRTVSNLTRSRRGATETIVSKPTEESTLRTARTQTGWTVGSWHHSDLVWGALRILVVFVVQVPGNPCES
jgi:hypothetical protein